MPKDTKTTSTSSRFYTGWVGRRPPKRRKTLTKAECKKRGLSRRDQFEPRKRNTRSLIDYVGALATADHRQIVQHVQKATRQVMGTCWHSSTVTPEQQSAVYRAAEYSLKADGVRVRSDQLARLTKFWLDAYDSAKALRFKLRDLGIMVQAIEQRFPACRLEAINAKHGDKLDGRRLDYFRLALICCGTAKNSLVANGRTRIEECGVSALVELLADAGINANGSMIRIARDILESIGLIKCIDRSYRTASTWYRSAGRCQRWTPAGATWDLPFLNNIKRDELTDAQRAEFDAHQVAKEVAEQARLRDLNSMQSVHLPSYPSLPSIHSIQALIQACEAPSHPTYNLDDPLQGVLDTLKGEIMGYFQGDAAPMGQGTWVVAPGDANDWDGSVDHEAW